MSFLLLLLCYGGFYPSWGQGAVLSPGCGQPLPSHVKPGNLASFNMVVTSDPNFPNTSRSYGLYVPKNYEENTPVPLMLYYHGQYGNAMQDARSTSYSSIGDEYGLISAYPQGLGDGNCGTGWNVGSLDPAMGGTCDKQAGSCCYSSCKQLNVCSGDGQPQANCEWSTCHDDVAFTTDLIALLASELCLDLGHLFATGASNGGMMQHWLYSQIPTQFMSYVPVYGLPLVGFLDVPTALQDKWIMAIHDRTDDVIPDNGGWAYGWEYISSNEVYGTWASLKGCDAEPVSISTPYDGGKDNMACTEWPNCQVGRVIHCLYDGWHGSWPQNEEQLTWWFWNQTLSQADEKGDPVLF